MKKSKNAARSAKSGVGSPTPDHDSRATSAGDQDALAFLKEDHGKVEALFRKFESAQHQQAQGQIAKELCGAIATHARLMEDVVYPELRMHGADEDALDRAQVKLDGIKMLINDLRQQKPDTPYYRAKIKILAEQLQHHANEEHDDDFFAKAREAGIDMDKLGGKLAAHRQELTEKADSNRLEPLQIRSLGLSDQQEKSMTQGRYGQRGRDRYQDDDDYATSSQGSGQRGRSSGSGQETYGQQYRAGGQQYRDDDYQSGQGYERGGRYGQNDYGSENHGQREQYGRSSYGQSGRGQYGLSDQYGRGDHERGSSQQSGQYGRSEYGQQDQGRYGRDHQQGEFGGRAGRLGYRGERYGRTEEYRETRGGMQRGQGDWQNDDQERYGEGRASGQGYDEDRERFSQGPYRERREYQSGGRDYSSQRGGQQGAQAGYEDDYDDRRARSRSRTQDDDDHQTRRGRNGNGSRVSTF